MSAPRIWALVLVTLALAACSDGELHVFEPLAAAAGQAGSGGSAGSGGGAAGTAGAAGGSAQGGSSAAPSDLLLDDFEDQDNHADPDGWWYSADDGTGPTSEMTFEAVTGRGVSRYAARLRAGPTTDFGAFLGLDLPGGIFDASDHAAVSFFARVDATRDLSLRFQDPPGTQFRVLVTVDTDWGEVRVPFTDFVSDEGTPMDPSELSHLQFWIAGSNPAFELWVDDVFLLQSD